jgi:inosine/xanthosine triphosphatase
VEVLAVDTDLNLPSQPIGDQTIDCAVKRAEAAMVKKPADLAVGIEGGLFRSPQLSSGYLALQWCAILDRKGWKTLGCSSGFELPLKVVEAVVSGGRELSEVMVEFSGVEGLGRKEGAVGVLSRGLLKRVELTEQAVLMAMIPRLNETHYFSKQSSKAGSSRCSFLSHVLQSPVFTFTLPASIVRYPLEISGSCSQMHSHPSLAAWAVSFFFTFRLSKG